MTENLSTRRIHSICKELDFDIPTTGKVKRRALLKLVDGSIPNILVVGLKSGTSVSFQPFKKVNCSFTGNLGHETPGIEWKNYMLAYSTPRHYNYCILTEPDFINTKPKSEKIVNANTVFIPSTRVFKFETTLLTKGFQNIEKETITIDNIDKEFKVYSRIRKKQKPKCILNQKNPILVSVSDDIFNSKIETGITQSRFSELISEKEFIENYRQSLEKLYDYKMTRYSEIRGVIEDGIRKSEAIASSLKLKGITELDAKQFFSAKADGIMLSISISSLIERVEIERNGIRSLNLRKIFLKVLGRLDNLVGRDNVKKKILNMLFAFSKSYTVFADSFSNFCITGCAGVGKTEVAKMIAEVFSMSKIFVNGSISVISRSNLVAGFIGQTATKTKSVLMNSLEGIVFIDEAYQLGGTGKDFGPEALTEIVNFLDKYIGLGCVIIAGYKDKIYQEFFPTNEGLDRRFPHRLDLKNYSALELTKILFSSIKINLSEQIRNYIYSVIDLLNSKSVFNNQAGDILNLAQEISISILTTEGEQKNAVIAAFQSFIRTKNESTGTL